MLVLGIETSCDETAAAVVERPATPRRWRIRSNVVASQVDIHREWGGVVPELASRQHVRDICGVVERALADGGAALDGRRCAGGDAGARSRRLAAGRRVVREGRGVGARASRWWRVQSPGRAHRIDLARARRDAAAGDRARGVGRPHQPVSRQRRGRVQLLGRTRDDAAGEAYDKVAKLLALGYPGGPIIDRLAREGNDDARFAGPARG